MNSTWIRSVALCAIVVTIVFLLVVGCEYVLRKHIGLGDPVVYDSHELWGYSPRANAKYSRLSGNVVTINDAGLRSTNSWEKSSKRILFLGDSITYGGSYIDDRETFVELVCAQIASHKCFNGGVNAQGIMNMVSRSRYDNRIKGDDIRVFTFITNDFERGLRTASHAHFVLRDPPEYFPATWEVVNFLASYIDLKSLFGKNDSKKNLGHFEDQKRLARMFSLDILIDEVNRLKGEGKKVLLFYSPSDEDLKATDIYERSDIVIRLKKEFPENFVSLAPEVVAAHLSGRRKIFKDMEHYETAGHELVAKIISDNISSKFLR